MVNNQVEFGDYLRRLRRNKSLSTAQAAAASRTFDSVGVSASYITLLENAGINNPSLSKLQILAKVYGVTYAEIIAAHSGTEADSDWVANEKLAKINFGYKGMPKAKKEKLDPLIDMLEREYQRIMSEGDEAGE